MSPELIAPQRFGFENSHPTKAILVYETIGGHLQFLGHTDLTVFVKALKGKCPPQVVGFMDSSWDMLDASTRHPSEH
jgi:hypothetical protein